MFEALRQTDWYYWNNKNRKIYLMLLLNGAKAFKLKYSEKVSINYELGLFVSIINSFDGFIIFLFLQIMRSIFSSITVLARFKNKYDLNRNEMK